MSAPDYWQHEKRGSSEYRQWYNSECDKHESSIRNAARAEKVSGGIGIVLGALVALAPIAVLIAVL